MLLSSLLMLVTMTSVSLAMEDLYCGDANCYEVLELTRDASKSEIGKSYRRLASRVHPDRFKAEAEKAEAEVRFRRIAAAYEVLRDDESREEYDYMLDHPEEMWRNYYRYYRRRMAPKIDVRLVLAVAITVISAIQYYASWSNYEDALKYLSSVPKYRIQATEIARNEGLLKRDRKADRGRSKEDIKGEEEAIIKKVIEEKMDIRGGYAKPSVYDVLWVQLFLLPLTIYRWSYFYLRWFYKFGLRREEYGEQEKLYVIRKHMGLSENQFDALDAEERDFYLEQELWIKENFAEWKQQKDDEMRAKMAQSGRYKQIRRYLRNKGPDRMTFDDS